MPNRCDWVPAGDALYAAYHDEEWGLSSRDDRHLYEMLVLVRNRLKIESAVVNARATLAVRDELGSLAEYVWSFVGGAPIQNGWRTIADVPSETAESRAMSRDMKRRGFRFVGPTVCYAFMQATGLVNDHTVDCDRYLEVQAASLG
jgi:DNA-3-methyladenine glycosylase I